jgi:hypothetical protein
MVDDGTGTLQIGPLDQTINLIAPRTAVVLDNAAFGLCDKGVIRITDGGAPENLSTNRIDDDLNALIQYVGPATLASVAFAVAYEAEHLYVLCLPESPNATSCTVQYIYNVQTDAWVRWTLPHLTCGGINPYNGLLYFGRNAAVDGLNILWAERKSFSDDDFRDPDVAGTVPGVGTYTASSLTFTGDVTGTYGPGDLISYSRSGVGTLARILSAVYSSGGNTTLVTLDRSATWTAGDPFTLYSGIGAQIVPLPLVGGEPLAEKQWQSVYFYFRRSTVQTYQVSYSSEKQQVPNTYPMPGATQSPWLYSEALGYGLEPWGGSAQDVILKLALDQKSARGGELTMGLGASDALAGWTLSAIRIPFNFTTPRVKE